jgi:hypothetical protein
LNPERVREIMKVNQDGKKPKELNEYVAEVKVKEPDYENVVGQDSLNRFEHAFKKNNNKKKKKPGNNRPVEAVKSGDAPQQPKAANPNQRPQGNPGAQGSSENSNNQQRRNKRPNNRRRPNPNNPGNESPQ